MAENKDVPEVPQETKKKRKARRPSSGESRFFINGPIIKAALAPIGLGFEKEVTDQLIDVTKKEFNEFADSVANLVIEKRATSVDKDLIPGTADEIFPLFKKTPFVTALKEVLKRGIDKAELEGKVRWSEAAMSKAAKVFQGRLNNRLRQFASHKNLVPRGGQLLITEKMFRESDKSSGSDTEEDEVEKPKRKRPKLLKPKKKSPEKEMGSPDGEKQKTEDKKEDKKEENKEEKQELNGKQEDNDDASHAEEEKSEVHADHKDAPEMNGKSESKRESLNSAPPAEIEKPKLSRQKRRQPTPDKVQDAEQWPDAKTPATLAQSTPKPSTTLSRRELNKKAVSQTAKEVIVKDNKFPAEKGSSEKAHEASPEESFIRDVITLSTYHQKGELTKFDLLKIYRSVALKRGSVRFGQIKDRHWQILKKNFPQFNLTDDEAFLKFRMAVSALHPSQHIDSRQTSPNYFRNTNPTNNSQPPTLKEKTINNAKKLKQKKSISFHDIEEKEQVIENKHDPHEARTEPSENGDLDEESDVELKDVTEEEPQQESENVRGDYPDSPKETISSPTPDEDVGVDAPELNLGENDSEVYV